MTTTISNMIAEELLNHSFEMTRQFLKILNVKYYNNRPKIANIEIDDSRNKAIAYVEIENESFYLEFIFDTTNKIEISSIDTIPFISMSYMPTSEDLSTEELISLTSIKPTRLISKGDIGSNGKFEYNYNALVFETDSKPGRFESKLRYLLDILETDVEGLKALARQTDTYDIFVTIVYHIGNGNFTDLYLNKDMINRLSKLGLQLTFDIYANGNKFEEDKHD